MQRLHPQGTTVEDRPSADQADGDYARHPPASSGFEHRTRLRGIIESIILPRIATRLPPAESERAAACPTESDVESFVAAILSGDKESGVACIAELRRRVPPSTIHLALLAPAARRLGKMWEDDDCDFIDVSTGYQRLREFLELLRPVGGRVATSDLTRRVLLAPAPGETHVLGITIVAEFFARDGWDAERCLDGRTDDLLGASWFDILGFSLSCTRHLDRLGPAIAGARALSRNPGLRVIVGGPLFSDQPQLAAEVGADGTAFDAPSAVKLSRNLLSLQCSM